MFLFKKMVCGNWNCFLNVYLFSFYCTLPNQNSLSVAKYSCLPITAYSLLLNHLLCSQLCCNINVVFSFVKFTLLFIQSCGSIPGFSKPPKPIEEALTKSKVRKKTRKQPPAAVTADTVVEGEDKVKEQGPCQGDEIDGVDVGGHGDCPDTDQTVKKIRKATTAAQDDSNTLEELHNEDDKTDGRIQI